ncbi:molecular chaperone [Variovorax sp. OV329]|uniref:fimbrial biogenesis chaperone n=1 Tax=Variovorax sp. OV329 TaxID=1882825 RepID=UPI0008EA2E10|nr:molecular chaperone [Variovorax sp. OV329]SFN28514.1 fimbrial chaperone protein [Variovorax sp. OV329]
MRLKPLALLALGLVFHVLAGASGLQVAPTSLTLEAKQNADGLWLSNTGDGPISAQVRVYRWTQQNGEDQEVPTREVLVSPPMIQLAAADRQLIRVIRTGPPPADAEAAYRVVIDELPLPDSGPKKGVQFVLRYSVPVFMGPVADSPPQLSWKVRQNGQQAVLEVSNTGGTHAQVADLSFSDSRGKRTPVHPGLLGYVLPGAQMRWAVKPPPATFTSGGTLDTLINGSATQQNIPPIEPAR